MYSERHAFFDASYDGRTYRQEFRLDLRMLFPGILLVVGSVPLIVSTWPEPMTFGMTAIGLALAALSFVKRHRFSVSPDGYRISWSLGPLGRTTEKSSDEVVPVLSSGRRGSYQVVLQCGWQRLEPFIAAGSRKEGEAWLEFLRNVSHGVPAEVPNPKEKLFGRT